MTTPIAYTYEADHHCPKCAEKRFGLDENGEITGDEGNKIHPVYKYDKWHVCSEYLDSAPDFLATLACGDCDAVLAICTDCIIEIGYHRPHHVTIKRDHALWRWECECTEGNLSMYFGMLDAARLDVLEHILDGSEDTIIVDAYDARDEYEPVELLEAIR